MEELGTEEGLNELDERIVESLLIGVCDRA